MRHDATTRRRLRNECPAPCELLSGISVAYTANRIEVGLRVCHRVEALGLIVEALVELCVREIAVSIRDHTRRGDVLDGKVVFALAFIKSAERQYSEKQSRGDQREYARNDAL